MHQGTHAVTDVLKSIRAVIYQKAGMVNKGWNGL